MIAGYKVGIKRQDIAATIQARDYKGASKITLVAGLDHSTMGQAQNYVMVVEDETDWVDSRNRSRQTAEDNGNSDNA